MNPSLDQTSVGIYRWLTRNRLVNQPSIEAMVFISLVPNRVPEKLREFPTCVFSASARSHFRVNFFHAKKHQRKMKKEAKAPAVEPMSNAANGPASRSVKRRKTSIATTMPIPKNTPPAKIGRTRLTCILSKSMFLRIHFVSNGGTSSFGLNAHLFDCSNFLGRSCKFER